MKEQWYTIREAGEITGMGYETIRKNIHRGKIKAIQPPMDRHKGYKIEHKDLEAFVGHKLKRPRIVEPIVRRKSSSDLPPHAPGRVAAILKNPGMIDVIAQHLRVGVSRSAAAQLAGIHGSTLDNYLQRARKIRAAVEGATGYEPDHYDRVYLDLLDAILLAESQAEAVFVGRINQAGKPTKDQKTDWRANAWLLERRNPAEWGSRKYLDQHVTVSGKVEVSVSFDTIALLDVDEGYRQLIDRVAEFEAMAIVSELREKALSQGYSIIDLVPEEDDHHGEEHYESDQAATDDR